MDILTAVFVAPFLDMADSPAFFFEVVIGGLMTGVMYSLVALGFVLIFKASSVFNFAQGVFALFAAMTLVGLMTGTVPFALDKALPGMPAFVAIILTGVVMVGLAFVVERVVLRPMVNQDHIIMFMSTIGIAFVLEGFGDLMWGSDVKLLDVGIPTGSFFFLDMMIQVFDLWAAAIAGILVISLAIFFQKTRTGRALRAVADDHQAALSVGIPLKNYLGRCLVGGRDCRSGRRDHVGVEIRCAVQSLFDCLACVTCFNSRRLHIRAGGDCRRPNYRRR